MSIENSAITTSTQHPKGWQYKRVDVKVAFKSTLQMSVPIVTARVSSAISGFISMLLVAHLGHAELAASALVNSVLFTVMMTAWSMLFSVGVVVGHAHGAKEDIEVGIVVRQGLLLSIFFAIPLILILWNIEPILLWCKQDPRLVYYVGEFFRGYVWGILPNLWWTVLGQLAIGISKQKLATFYILLVLPIITLGGYILMFGKFGMPHLGIRGMGYANSLAMVIGLITMSYHFVIVKAYRKYELFKWDFKKNLHYLRKLLSIGWPISAMMLVEFMAFSVSTIFVGWLGEVSLAAQQITLQINMVAFMVPYGIAQASTILVSQALGRRDFRAVRLLGYIAGVLALIFVLIFAAFYLTIPRYLIGFYLNVKAAALQPTVIMAAVLLSITALMNLFDALRTVATCALRGLYDTLVPMWVSLGLSCALSIPVGYILAFPLHFGVYGIRWGFTICFFVSAIILLRRFYWFSSPKHLLKLEN